MHPNKSLFRVQPNGWSCGPAALRHALLCYGEQHDVRKLARWARTTRKGTHERHMVQAARRAGYDLRNLRYASRELTVSTIRALLRLGQPVIVIVDKWEHWVCAFEATARHLFIVDSDAPKSQLVQKLTWHDALDRMVKSNKGENEFNLYPLTRRT